MHHEQTGRTSTRKTLLARLIGVDLTLALVIVGGTSLLLANVTRFVSSAIDWVNGVTNLNIDLLQSAILLNVALLIVSWRRYRDLSREVQERGEAEARASRLALRDALTGLFNRRALLESGNKLLERTIGADKQMAVVMIDLDHFKNINDVHGHATGDAHLRTVAAIIVDSLPSGSLIARLGGDEFACALVFDPGQEAMVTERVDRIIARLSEPLDVEGMRLQATASAGIALVSQGGTSIEALIRRADIAMYAAKNAGRARVCWFDDSMERLLQQRNQIETDIRDGLPRCEFVPYFEQQIDLSSGRITGFEVLARWNHPSRGLVMPDEFIGIAEETGLIGDISMQVTRQALEIARDWDNGITISVNISPAQLRDPWLAQKIVKLLLETGFPPARFEIEITETALFDNMALARSIITSLKNQGMRIALDDFGTGYSLLAHLRALPFDRLKIDKSFVTSMVDNNESAAIVNAITGLGENLNLTITAEGIEDAEIAERLRPMGIDKGQGWHFGKPLCPAEAQALMAGGARPSVWLDSGAAVIPSTTPARRAA